LASEVRSLAQRSAQAAMDVKGRVTNSTGQAREGVDLVHRAGTSLAEIVGAIDYERAGSTTTLAPTGTR
jgi:methyl-accepting chemotaxis protein